jgi:hypothetical protein
MHREIVNRNNLTRHVDERERTAHARVKAKRHRHKPFHLANNPIHISNNAIHLVNSSKAS